MEALMGVEFKIQPALGVDELESKLFALNINREFGEEETKETLAAADEGE